MTDGRKVTRRTTLATGLTAAAGVTVEHICHDGMIHNFHAMGAVLPQGRLVLHQIGEQVRRTLGI